MLGIDAFLTYGNFQFPSLRSGGIITHHIDNWCYLAKCAVVGIVNLSHVESVTFV